MSLALASGLVSSTPPLVAIQLNLMTPQVLRTTFNTYFCSVGKTRAMKFSEQYGIDHLKFLDETVSNSIYLKPTSPQEIFKEINSLNFSKSPALDGIPAYFIRLACNIVAIPLSTSRNLSFSEDAFPKCMKNLKLFLCLKLAVKINK